MRRAGAGPTRRGGFRGFGSASGLSAAQVQEQVVALATAQGGTMLTSDFYTGTTNVTSLVDHAKPSRSMTITGTLPAPVANENFNNALILNPTGTQFGVSTETAASYIWMHRFPQWQVHVYQHAGAASNFIWATGLTGSAIHMRYSTDAATTLWSVSNGATFTNGIAAVLNTPTYTDYQYTDPGTPNDIIHRRKGTPISSVDTTFVPTASAAGATLGLFRRAATAGSEFNGLWAASLAMPYIPTADERALVQLWILLKYGIAA